MHSELVVAGILTEAEASPLFVDPGATSDGSETPWQGWHRVYPPLPVPGGTPPVAPSPPSLSARRRAREAVRQQVEALQQRGTPPSLSARRRAREAVRQQVEALQQQE